MEQTAGTRGRRAAPGLQEVRAATAGTLQPLRSAARTPRRTAAKALLRIGTQVRTRTDVPTPDTTAAQLARTGGQALAGAAVRAAATEGSGGPTRARPRTTRVRQRHAGLDLVR